MNNQPRFSGRIIQISESLDVHDAVTFQVLQLGATLRNMGRETITAAVHFHEDLRDVVTPLDKVKVREDDIIIHHFFGYAPASVAWLSETYATKIIYYQNITPAEFFKVPYDAHLFNLCQQGRQQLKDIVGNYHYTWAASQYNLDELLELGASPDKSHIVGNMVAPPIGGQTGQDERDPGTWLFVGRIASNKDHVGLLELFAEVRAAHPERAQHLYCVGAYDPGSGYGASVEKRLRELKLQRFVTFTGKISDEEREDLFRRAQIYVSLSQHEGFGVPLLEAPLRGLPVVALGTSAVTEVMGEGGGCYATLAELREALIDLLGSDERLEALAASQLRNAARFHPRSVRAELVKGLEMVLPQPRRFKRLSIVICTWGRADYLARVLEYLQNQSCGDFEVIVVSGPIMDGTDEVLKKWEGKIKIAYDPGNLSTARNVGINLADGDIVAFLDDDALPFDDWVETVFREYNSRPLSFGGLGGPVYYAGTLWFQAQDNGINSEGYARVSINSGDIGKAGWYRYNTGTNATFTREALAAVGGFDEQYDYYLDESELCYRLQQHGYLIGYVPELYVRHEFAQSHHRMGKYHYNWRSICKNTTYFVGTHGGRSGEALKKYMKKRLQEERVDPLDEALREGEISQQDHEKHVKAVWDGFAQGLEDIAHWPRTCKVTPRPGNFLEFARDEDHPVVGKTVPQLHICIVTREFAPCTHAGGIGTLYYHLFGELLLMGHQVSVIVPSPNDSVHVQGRFSIHFTSTKPIAAGEVDRDIAGNFAWSVSALEALTRVHAERPIDIVDSPLWDFEALAFAMIDRQERPPLVVRLVTPFAKSVEINQWDVSAERHELYMACERALMERADRLIPISECIRETILEEYELTDASHVDMGYCGIAPWPMFDVNQNYGSLPEFREIDPDLMENGKMVLFVGRLEKRKGIDLVLEAAKDILAADPDVFIIVAGRDTDGYAAELSHLSSTGGKRRVFYVGEVNDEVRNKLMARAWCLLFPSRYESFGLVPLEAFIHGTPVIAARAGAIPEVVIDGACGLLFEAGDGEDLARQTVRLVQDADLRKTLSDGALVRAHTLSARASARHSVKVYAAALADSGRTG